MKKLNMKKILLGAAVIGCFIFYPNTTVLTAAAEESGCDNMDITQDDSTTMASEGDIAVKNDKTPPKAKAVYKTKKYKYKNKAGKTIKGRVNEGTNAATAVPENAGRSGAGGTGR